MPHCSASSSAPPAGRADPQMLLRRLACRKTSPWGWQQRAALTGSGSGGSAPPAAVAAAKRGRRPKEAPADADSSTADADAAAGTSEGPLPVDLSLHAPRGPQWDPAALPQRWLAFSDLHVSLKTRATCLAVLEAVHEAAAARGAGILFLGGCRAGAGGARVHGDAGSAHAARRYQFYQLVACSVLCAATCKASLF